MRTKTDRTYGAAMRWSNTCAANTIYTSSGQPPPIGMHKPSPPSARNARRSAYYDARHYPMPERRFSVMFV